jgi:hypothetical protein
MSAVAGDSLSTRTCPVKYSGGPGVGASVPALTMACPPAPLRRAGAGHHASQQQPHNNFHDQPFRRCLNLAVPR